MSEFNEWLVTIMFEIDGRKEEWDIPIEGGDKATASQVALEAWRGYFGYEPRPTRVRCRLLSRQDG